MAEIEIDATEARMITGLKDKDRNIRLVCAMGLCSRGKKQFIKPVVGYMEKITWDEVEDLASSLFLFGKPVVPFLVPLLHNGKKSTAACAARALGRIGGDEAAEALIDQLVSLPTKSEPTEALAAMGTDAIPFLVPLLEHSKADVREMAAFALGKIGDMTSLKLLENLAQTDRSEKVKEVAGRAARWVRGQEQCTLDLRNTFGAIELGPR